LEIKNLKEGEISKRNRDFATELIAIEKEEFEGRKISKFKRDLTAELVFIEIEGFEGR
jgi:hypothetical protein